MLLQMTAIAMSDDNQVIKRAKVDSHQATSSNVTSGQVRTRFGRKLVNLREVESEGGGVDVILFATFVFALDSLTNPEGSTMEAIMRPEYPQSIPFLSHFQSRGRANRSQQLSS